MNVLDIENITVFGIALYTFFANIYYVFYETSSVPYTTITILDNISPVIGAYSFTDIFFTKSPDVVLHHIFSLGICWSNYYYYVIPQKRFTLMYTVLNTELSSIFYVLHLFSFKTPILLGKNIRKNVKSIVGISPTMVLLFHLPCFYLKM